MDSTVPRCFWAACRICDLEALSNLIELAHRYPVAARIVDRQTYTMILHCKWSGHAYTFIVGNVFTGTQTPKGSSRTHMKRIWLGLFRPAREF